MNRATGPIIITSGRRTGTPNLIFGYLSTKDKKKGFVNESCTIFATFAHKLPINQNPNIREPGPSLGSMAQ